MSARSRATDPDNARQREPRRLGDIVPQLMARRGYARILADGELTEVWQLVSGPWASHSRPGTIRRGQLEIIVSNSLLVQELTFQKEILLRGLAQHAPNLKIRDLRFTVGAID
jgi:predicted nucleic acid-binding Zn ribbon protein